MGSYEGIDWLYFLLSVGEVVLADRSPYQFFKMFILLSQAGRILFKPSFLTEKALQTVDQLLKQFLLDFYTQVYAGRQERLRLCRPTMVALLDMAPNLRACGPAWSYWKFPVERLKGNLTRLIRSRLFPYASLSTVESAKYSAELVKTFAESHVPEVWAEATGTPARRDSQTPAGTFSVCNEPKIDLLTPNRAAAALVGQKLV